MGVAAVVVVLVVVGVGVGVGAGVTAAVAAAVVIVVVVVVVVIFIIIIIIILIIEVRHAALASLSGATTKFSANTSPPICMHMGCSGTHQPEHSSLSYSEQVAATHRIPNQF